VECEFNDKTNSLIVGMFVGVHWYLVPVKKLKHKEVL